VFFEIDYGFEMEIIVLVLIFLVMGVRLLEEMSDDMNC
jgi:hypothetical protein